MCRRLRARFPWPMTDVMRSVSFETERQGYRRDHVDAAFAALADELDETRRRMGALQERAANAADPVAQLGGRVSAILQAAEEAAAARESEAEQTARGIVENAERRLRAAQEECDELRRAAESEVAGLRQTGIAEQAEAEREAATIRQGAKDQAAALLARARDDANTMADQARIRHESFQRLEAQLAERVEQAAAQLETLRACLQSPTAVLEHEVVGEGIGDVVDVTSESPILARLRNLRDLNAD